MQLLTKHLMRFARYSTAISDIKHMPAGKNKFARDLAKSIITQKECSSLANWIKHIRLLETEIKLLSYDEILKIQTKTIKFIR